MPFAKCAAPLVSYPQKFIAGMGGWLRGINEAEIGKRDVPNVALQIQTELICGLLPLRAFQLFRDNRREL